MFKCSIVQIIPPTIENLLTMHVETFRAYCISKACVTEDFPFNQSTLVFKLMGKMFALTDLEKSFSITLKCDPEKAVVLRENYEVVKPAYHMNKKHWNDILIDGSLQHECLLKLIDHSYDLVKNKLTRKERACIEPYGLE